MREFREGETICGLIRGLKTKITAHMSDRGTGLKMRALAEADEAILMAKRMQAKLEAYKKEKEDGSTRHNSA